MSDTADSPELDRDDYDEELARRADALAWARLQPPEPGVVKIKVQDLTEAELEWLRAEVEAMHRRLPISADNQRLWMRTRGLAADLRMEQHVRAAEWSALTRGVGALPSWQTEAAAMLDAMLEDDAEEPDAEDPEAGA